MTYKEQLDHPLWQKKRLEILERDNFTCKLCLDTETQLHIHHKKYHPRKKAWEYQNSNFITYCKHCHCLVEEYKEWDMKPIITSKLTVGDSVVTQLYTIFLRQETNLILFINHYIEGKIHHRAIIEYGKFKELDNLFESAQKLTQ